MQKRKTNMELVRFFAIMFVIIHHLLISNLGYTDFTRNLDGSKVLQIVIGTIIEPFIIICVNLFFLISGYFKIKLSAKKVLRFILIFYFYIIILNIIGIIVGQVDFDVWNILKSVIFSIEKYWYIMAYIFLMLVSPLLNLIIENIDKNKSRYFLYVYIIAFCVYSLKNDSVIGIKGGYSFISATCLYLVGGFIRKEYIFSISSKKSYYFIWYVVFSIINSLLCFVLIILKQNVEIIISLSSPLVVIASICFFKFFTLLQINETSKLSSLIIWIAGGTYATYILHFGNGLSSGWLRIPFIMIVEYNWWLGLAIIVPYALIMCVVCTLVDNIFNISFGKVINYMCDFIVNTFSRIKDSIFNLKRKIR